MNKNKMQEQMDLFGGLKDEGGKVDRKSGNKVPIGSTKKEVRDDIPAQLSEGEFVLPADVVRYHGLEKLMKLRQQAKGGLKTMDKMGQMGNADEATLPDDIPFKPEFQQGGAVQAPQVMQSNTVPGVQFTPQQPQQQIPSMFAPPAVGVPVPFTPPVQRPVYTPPTYQEPIPFKTLIGTDFGQLQKTETRKYVNDNGEELFIPFVNGKPIYPIPAGYKEFKEDTTTPPPVDKKVTAPTATVTGDDSGDDLSTSIKTTKVSKIASDAAGGQKSLKDFFTTGKGASIAGSMLGMSMLGPVGAIIGGLLGKSLSDNKQELAQQMGAIPGTTAPIGPERDFEKLSQEAYGKSIAEMAGILGGPQGSVTPTFSYGFNPGSVDVVTGGTFNSAGIAVDENGNMSTSNGVPSYASFSDFVNAMSASAKTGYYGGPVSKAEYDNMSPKGKDLYDAYATETKQPSYGTKDPDVEDISKDVDTKTQTQPDPIDVSSPFTSTDPFYGGDEGDGTGEDSPSGGDPTGGGGGSDIGTTPDDTDTSIDDVGTEEDPDALDPFGGVGDDVDTGGDDSGGGGCVIATHGLSTGGFTAMEKAKAELWCVKTYHGKWYGEAFRRGYRAAGMKHINAGTAPSVYQEFKDFVAYGRGIKKGWKIGFNYYLRTIAFFIHGLFIK
mgnify:CR=1 FL=1